MKDELEFAQWKQEHSRRREQPEEKQGRETTHGPFGDWQVDQCQGEKEVSEEVAGDEVSRGI